MNEWRRVRLANLKAEPHVVSTFGVTVSSVPLAQFTASLNAGGYVVVSSGHDPVVTTCGSNYSPAGTTETKTWSTCRALTEGMNSALVIKPGEVALYDHDSGITKAWSADWSNLGRNMTHVLSWAHERSKQT